MDMKLTNFINSNKTGFFGVTGGAGSGKTYLVVKTLRNNNNVIYLGATNKVVNVIRNSEYFNSFNKDSVKTIHRYFNFRMWKDENNKTNTSYSAPKELKDIIVIDEISLINNELFEEILKIRYKTKFILIGDPLQIPPVKESYRNKKGFLISKIFDYFDDSIDIKEQHRQNVKSNLYIFINGFRNNMSKPIRLAAIKNSKYNNGNDISYLDIKDNKLIDYLKNDRTTVIAYKNLTVLGFDWKIGMLRTGIKRFKLKDINIGEKLSFNSYYKDGKIVFYTSDNVTILSKVEREEKKFNIEYKYLLCEIETDGWETFYIRVSLGYNETLRNVWSKKNREIKKDISLSEKAEWHNEYMIFKNSFAELKNVYSITAHKSQGSTYDNVVVPVYDFANRDHKDVNQLIYTAISRTKNKLIFVDKKEEYNNSSNRYRFSESQISGITSSQDWKCGECGKEIFDIREIEIHHKKPLKDGGTNTINNLISLCHKCHKAEHY